MIQCPSVEELELMLDDRLTGAELDSVSSHVSECTRCQSALEQLTADTCVSIRSASLTTHVSGNGPAPPSAPTLFLDHLKDPSVFAKLSTLRMGIASPCESARGPTRDGDASARFPQVPGYEIVEELGRGGMGVVYLAMQTGLNRMVALKMIPIGAHANPKDLDRFRQEAEAVARLRHPNIVQIHDVGEAGGLPYFALELVEQGNLGTRIRGEQQDFEAAARLIETLAKTIYFTHQHGIVHRDLKPANILLGRAPFETKESSNGSSHGDLQPTIQGCLPKITDFGLAKRLDEDHSGTPSGEIVGTPSYMAPEQAGGKAQLIGPATDIYSLGAILYELLTARPPFKGATPVDTVIQVLHEEPVRPSQLRPGLPLDLETICLKCLNKDPSQRYATAEALADDLYRFRKGVPILARPVRFPERIWKAARRRPVIAALLVGIWLSIVLGFAGITWQWHRATVARDAAVVEKQNKEIQRQHAEQARAEALTERRKAQAALYYSRISRSQLQWRLSNVSEAVQSLLECMPQPDQADPRGWEWHYLLGLFHSDLFTFTHSFSANGGNAAFHPDGRTIFSLVGGHAIDDRSHPGEVRIWDASTGDLRHAFRAPGTAHRLVLRHDGQRMALATTDGSVLVWETATGAELVRTPPEGQFIAAIAFSPDGEKLAWASWDQTVKICDAATGRILHVLRGHGGRVQCVAFHPDGKTLASGDTDAIVKIWDTRTGDEISTLRGHKSPVYGVAFNPDGSLLATGGSNGNLKIWDMSTGKVIQSLTGRSGAVLDSCFSPDGRYLAYGGGDGTVRVWDIESGIERIIFRGHSAQVESIKFSPEGQRLVSSSPSEGLVKVWDFTRHPEHSTFARVPGGADAQVKVRDLTGRAESTFLARTGPDLEALAFHADGKHIVSVAVGGNVQVWDAATGLLKEQRPVAISDELVSPAVLAAFSQGGERLVGRAREDNRVAKIWDVSTGAQRIALRGHTLPIICLRFSGDNSRVVSCACETKGSKKLHEIKVWDASTGENLFSRTGDGMLFNSAFSPDGNIVAVGGEDGLLEFIDWSRSRITTKLPGHSSPVTALAFNGDGKLFAAAGIDKTLKLYELDGFDPSRGLAPNTVHTLAAAPPFVCDLAFSPDGRRLAGVTRDAVKIWDVRTHQEVITLRGAVQRHWDPIFNSRVVFSPNGKRLLGTNWDESISMWEATLDDRSDALAKRQAARRAAAEGRIVYWHLEEAEHCLEHHNRSAALFHFSRLRDAKLPEPMQARRDRLAIQLKE